MNCKISKSQYNTDHQISRSQHFVDQDISRSRYFLGQRRLKALFRLRVETKWKKSLENNYWKYILAVMYTLIASQKNEISFQKLWWYINKTNEFSVVICVKKVKKNSPDRSAIFTAWYKARDWNVCNWSIWELFRPHSWSWVMKSLCETCNQIFYWVQENWQ